ncbi:MAG: hypothetical protein D6696_19560 [Acidobacteria bacterium]|nr:MAG: hypothetical protein D6696_19560 [Acidobacteriota bacterium]
MAPAASLRHDWRQQPPRELWRRSIGEGYSGIVVAGRRLFTLDCDERSEYLVALDAASGDELWRLALGQRFDSSRGNGPRATPAVDGDVVYALSALGDLHAARVDDGRGLWHVKLRRPPSHGYAGSPLVDGERLIVLGHLDSDDTVLALDKTSGEVLWSALPGPLGYASPVVAELAGRRQLLAMIGDQLAGLEPADGTVLWRYPWPTSYRVNAADPLVLPPDRIFISSSYDQGAALLRLRPEAPEPVEVVWRSRVMKNHFNGSVRAGDYLYGFDNGVLKCIAVAGGEERWRQRGFGKGSLILADGHLVVLGERGDLALVEARPEAYVEKGRVKALIGRSWTSPTLAGSWLFVRNQQEIAGLEVGS